MNNLSKKIVIAGILTTVCGIIIACIGCMGGGKKNLYFDNTGIHINSKNEQSRNMETIAKKLGSFHNIDTDLDLYNVDLIPSDHYAIEAVYNNEYGSPIIKVENDTLIVKDRNKIRFNVNIFGFVSNQQKQSVKIYYPQSVKLNDVTLRGGATVSAKDLVVEKAEFDVDLGKLELTNISAQKLKVEMDSGNCNLNKIKADDLVLKNDLGKTTLEEGIFKTLKIDADSGNVSISDVEAEYSNLNLDLGNLSANNFISKGMKAVVDSGNVDFQGRFLGNTDIDCDLGNVTIEPGAAKEQFNYICNADLGKISIDGNSVSESITEKNSAKNTLKIKVNSGNIKITFNK